jgi:very-short-patch-repair endonuclease
MNHQKIAKEDEANSSKITPQARKLSAALTKNGIKHKMEAYDGYKHVDISIDWAKLNIEIDGSQHLLSSKQLYADIKRDSYSHDEEIHTIRITNEAVDRYADKIAENIAKVARRKRREDADESDIFSQLASDISSLFSDWLS